MWEAVLEVLVALWGVLREAWPRTKRFLSILAQQPWKLALCILLFAASAGLTAWYGMRSNNYEAIVNNTLQANLEATPQNYKGLEAFIFSNVAEGVDVDLSTQSFNPQFIGQYQHLHKRIQDILSKGILAQESNRGVQLHLPANGRGDVLTDDNNDVGFLFLPVYLFRPLLDRDQIIEMLSTGGGKIKLIARKEINEKLPTIEDVALTTDSAFTKLLSEELQGFTQLSVFEGTNKYLDLEPAQVYMITKNGLNRIFTNQVNAAAQYGSQFPATTFFPSRPYFWPPFQTRPQKVSTISDPASFSPSQGQKVGDFFWVSRPYFDLGGSGIVITLTRGLVLDGQIRAAICFDMMFAPTEKLFSALEKRVAELGGTSRRVECHIGRGETGCQPLQGSAPFNDLEEELRKKLSDDLTHSKEELERSRILGNIHVLNPGDKSGEVRFSLPISQTSEQDTTSTLLVVALNINNYRLRTTWIAFCAATLFGITTVFLAYLWGSTMLQRREYEDAFERVARVMYNSPTPYLHLDSDDTIVDASASFWRLLGYAPDSDAIAGLKRQRFGSFCADESSRKRYSDVEAARKTGRAVEPYVLQLRKADHQTVTVKVFGAAIPSSKPGELPETFGILLDPTIGQETFRPSTPDDENTLSPKRVM
jgi:PAS domain-containing protein